MGFSFSPHNGGLHTLRKLRKGEEFNCYFGTTDTETLAPWETYQSLPSQLGNYLCPVPHGNLTDPLCEARMVNPDLTWKPVASYKKHLSGDEPGA